MMLGRLRLWQWAPAPSSRYIMNVPARQKALLLEQKFGELILAPDFPVSEPADGEVLVQVKAAALNPADWKIQKYGLIVDTFPAVLGVDIAGEIVETGKGVTGLAVGDRVLFKGARRGGHKYTGFQEYTVADVKTLSKIPARLSYDEASTIPGTLCTAFIGFYQAQPHGLGLKYLLEENGRGAYQGEPVIVIGGAGSVGQFTIQLAKLSGFDPIITTASSKHEGYLKSLGATHVLDRNAPLTKAIIQTITSVPLTIVFDAIGTEETQKVGLEIVASGGSLSVIQPPREDIAQQAVIEGKKVVFPLGDQTLPRHAKLMREMWAELASMLEEGDIKPLRFEVLPGGLKGITAGLRLLEEDKVSGVKLVAHPQETDD
ncbi:hypothetical protein NMY22_g2300 [Coprinellus aureogranulatus]|nr:hypothetical protein NMY22_g2300 [Coprinellus aureogranulatus]